MSSLYNNTSSAKPGASSSSTNSGASSSSTNPGANNEIFNSGPDEFIPTHSSNSNSINDVVDDPDDSDNNHVNDDSDDIEYSDDSDSDSDSDSDFDPNDPIKQYCRRTGLDRDDAIGYMKNCHDCGKSMSKDSRKGHVECYRCNREHSDFACGLHCYRREKGDECEICENGRYWEPTCNSDNKLIVASFDGDVKKCFKYIRKGIDVNELDKDTCVTALWTAADKGHVSVCKVLLKHGASVDLECGFSSCVPLGIALENENFPVCDLLIKHGALDNLSVKNIVNFLCLGLDKNYSSLYTQLITRGALDKLDPDDLHEVFSAAVKVGVLSVCKVVSKYVTDLNELTNGRTHLGLAAKNGHLEICKFLIKKGVTIDLVDSFKYKPLGYAFRQRHFEVCEFLIKHGASVRDLDPETSLCDVAECNDLALAELFIQNGFDVNKVLHTCSRKTPLLIAAGKGHLEMCELLINNKADANINYVTVFETSTPYSVASSPEIKNLLRWNTTKCIRTEDRILMLYVVLDDLLKYYQLESSDVIDLSEFI
jgi:ankyrin repeat protein